MKDVVIRKFEHTDVDAFIRLSNSSFADEAIASGITPDDFAQETRKIFRWKMVLYKLLTALMGVKWEAFVAEKDGKVVGGGMYIGRNNHMSITNLMVDPEYRRQGIGQALLIKRLERLSERGFPCVTARVLDTNTASLENLKKQNFVVYNQYSIYERNLPLPATSDSVILPITVRDVKRSDKVLFRALEKQNASPLALHINGSLETQYFLSGWQKLYARYTGYSKWTKALVAQGETICFISADFQVRQRKGFIIQPVVADERLPYLPAALQKVGTWLEASGKESMVIEIPDGRAQLRDHLLDQGWRKQYTWLELIRWLDERARQKTQDL
jgi:ribosomal protein S18 acetylase RimI-like enzyme